MSMTCFSNLSIVIPVGPNDNSWGHLLKQLNVFGNEIEIILSACQSPPVALDELPDNARWIQSTPGRAHQLNAGAKQSSGQFIWFLHADTDLTDAVVEVTRKFIEADDHSMGYFKLKFANDGPIQISLNAWAANIRSRYFGLPFGDQGFIINKKFFEQLNGFDESVSMGEDLDFVVRLKAKGIQLQELSAQLITSSRRYQQHGWFSTTTRHLWLTWCLTRQAKRRLVISS